MLDVKQGPIETSDPAISEIPLVGCRGGGGTAEIDFGDGWKSRDLQPGFVGLRPPDQVCHFRLSQLDLRIIFVSQQAFGTALQDTPFSFESFVGLSGAMRPAPDAPVRAKEGQLGGGTFKSHAIDAAKFVLDCIEQSSWVRGHPVLGYD